MAGGREDTLWLLIFDNYDDVTNSDIREYYPYAAQDSIIVTSRLPDRISGQKVRVQPLSDIEESLGIPQTRFRRGSIRNSKSTSTVSSVEHYSLTMVGRSVFVV